MKFVKTVTLLPVESKSELDDILALSKKLPPQMQFAFSQYWEGYKACLNAFVGQQCLSHPAAGLGKDGPPAGGERVGA